MASEMIQDQQSIGEACVDEPMIGQQLAGKVEYVQEVEEHHSG